MKKEPHITEFTAKKGNGLHIRVTTTRDGKRIAIDGGRLYYNDYGTKADTLRQARKIRDKILTDIGFNSSMPTVAELHKKSFDLFPRSISTKERTDAMLQYCSLVDRPINTITLAELQEDINKYATQHTQERVKRYISFWKHIYKTALMLQLSIPDYTQIITVPKSKVIAKSHPREVTYYEFQKFLSAVEKSRSTYKQTIIASCWIMYYTGMRVQEVFGLYKSDIDLEGNVIHVRRSIGSTGLKSAQIVPLKTKKSLRDIPISFKLRPILETVVLTDSELLFTEADGSPIDTKHLGVHISNICKARKIHFTMYSLRHLFAADLFRQGVNPKVIQNLMGHQNEDMSLYYAFATEDEMEDAIQKRTQ